MRILFAAALLFTTTTIFSQGKTLYGVALVKPKQSQKLAWESAWKAHLAKFHNGESKRSVYEVVSGDNNGTYQLVEGPFAYADMDKDEPNSKAHDMDYENTVSAKVERDQEGLIYRYADTLSYNPELSSDKIMETVYYIKPGNFPEFSREIKRTVDIDKQINAPGGFQVFSLMMPGSKSQLVLRRNLKDGFKELETNYYPSTTEAFKKAYIAAYGQADWDKRTGSPGIYNWLDSYETFLVKQRKDLSSSTSKNTAKK